MASPDCAKAESDTVRRQMKQDDSMKHGDSMKKDDMKKNKKSKKKARRTTA
jgi:hypothetical protein